MQTCNKAPVVTLDNALFIIRDVQPAIMEAGYYLALAGGCLNNGQSANDIDLVAVPRAGDSLTCNLLSVLMQDKWELLASPTTHSRGRNITICHFSVDGFKVDLAVVGSKV